MNRFGKALWIFVAAVSAAWLLVTVLIGWRLMWFRRNAINANMAAVYRRYGENYQPVSRLRWVWIIFRSIPMTFFFAAFGIVMFLLHIPAAVWSFITGKPIGLPDLSAMDDECPK